MNAKFTESHVEEAAIDWLEGLGYEVLHGPEVSPDGSTQERASYVDVLLVDRFRKALRKLNLHLTAETLEEVLRKV